MSIVVGYIPTPEGQAALERAAEEAVLREQRLVIVNSQQGGEDWSGEDSQALRDVLEAVEKRLDAATIQHDVRSLVRGHGAAEDLLAVARETSASLIVIGVRRRSAVGKFILGSNAQSILLEADQPVLAVKATSR